MQSIGTGSLEGLLGRMIASAAGEVVAGRIHFHNCCIAVAAGRRFVVGNHTAAAVVGAPFDISVSTCILRP